jgi:hypothetical protein
MYLAVCGDVITKGLFGSGVFLFSGFFKFSLTRKKGQALLTVVFTAHTRT